jgi:hypothetical protein
MISKFHSLQCPHHEAYMRGLIHLLVLQNPIETSDRESFQYQVLSQPCPCHQDIVCHSRASNCDQCSN